MSVYALILAGTLFFPLLLSFDRKVAFWRRWPRAFAAAVIVAIPFIVWDLFAAARGDWGFAHQRVWPLRLGGLPVEEILFFLIAPMACLFIYECLLVYLKPRPFPFRRWPWLAGAALTAAAAVLVRGQFYTWTLLLFAAAFLVLCAVLGRGICNDARFWIAQALCLIPFLVVNGFLTGIPVVTYSPEAILGLRILTIPVEDFLYSVALTGGSFLVYGRLRGGLKT